MRKLLASYIMVDDFQDDLNWVNGFCMLSWLGKYDVKTWLNENKLYTCMIWLYENNDQEKKKKRWMNEWETGIYFVKVNI